MFLTTRPSPFFSIHTLEMPNNNRRKSCSIFFTVQFVAKFKTIHKDMENCTWLFLNLASLSVYFSTRLIVNSRSIQYVQKKKISFLSLHLYKNNTAVQTARRNISFEFWINFKDLLQKMPVHTVFWWGKPIEGDFLKDLSRLILQCILTKQGVMACPDVAQDRNN